MPERQTKSYSDDFILGSAPPPSCTSIYIHQCGTEKCQNGHSYGPAMREHYLIHCIFTGKGRFYDGLRNYDLRKGQGFLILPGIISLYQADMQEPWHYGWVGFSGSDAGHILRLCGISREYPVFDITDNRAMEECIYLLSGQYGTGGNSLEATSSLFKFFSLIKGADNRKSQGAGILDRATDYIHKNYSYHLTIPAIASYSGVTRSQLFRVFKQNIGMSTQEYIITVRLQNAVRLMRTTNLSVTEILFSCGFSDASHFSRQFKLRYGSTPSAYMKDVREGKCR